MQYLVKNPNGGNTLSEIIDDFLMPTLNEIRQSIRGIDDSYNNFWDILAEIVQNAIDAIHRGNIENGEVNLYINCMRNEIKITDNGCGIDPEDLPKLLKPFSTNKTGDDSQIGEKGVGLKFAIFQSTFFAIHTGNASCSANAEIRDARLWKQQMNESVLPLSISKSSDPYFGTEILLRGIQNDFLFSLSIPQMKYIIRSRTAIGNTTSIWKTVLPITVHLDMVDCNGNQTSEIIPYRYWLPTEILANKDRIDIADFEKWLSESDRTDIEKRNKLKNKVITMSDSIMHAGYREIRYWACFVPARTAWDTLSVKQCLANEDLLANEEWINEKSVLLYRPGIFTAVKGMPTGISVEHPTTGYSGYWSNVFIIFEDNALRFDIGRKSIHGLTANIYKNHAKDIFNRFLKFVVKYVSGTVEPYNEEWNREALIEEIKQLPDIGSQAIPFIKNPKDQEASVAAIFYELIGKGVINDVVPLISGYRNKYDLYAKWNNRTVIIEFKARLRNIVSDFDDARKMFDEMDYIVCWEVTDEDVAKLQRLSIAIEELQEDSLFGAAQTRIECCTHRLLINANVTPVYIIDLKRLLSSLR